jgi:hypothetical protein
MDEREVQSKPFSVDSKEIEHTIINVLSTVEALLELLGNERKISMRYINMIDLDPASPDYNPDGKIGHIRIVSTAR